MVTSVVVAGFAVLDGAVLGQLAYGVSQYRKHHEEPPGGRGAESRAARPERLEPDRS